MDRSHVKNILNKRLEEYMLEAEEDLKLTDANLKEKSLLRSSMAAKWLRYNYEENVYVDCGAAIELRLAVRPWAYGSFSH